MRARLSVAAVLFVAAVADPARAQLSFEAHLGGAHDAINYADVDPENRLATSGSLGAEYLLAGGRGRVSYSLDAATYTTPGDWSTLRHDLGGVYRADLSDSGRLRLFLGATAALRDNGDAWADAGYRALGGMANVEYRPSDGRTLRFGYRLDGRELPNIPELDQIEHDTFVSALFNFQTRTTLIGEVRLGAKSYAGGPTLPEVSPTVTQGGSGRGRGVRGSTVRSGLAASTPGGERAGRVAWRVRVAQSLADQTGLALDYSARHTFGTVPPGLVTTPAHFYDDGVYDDPYASDARTIGATLKQILGGAGAVRGWVGWQGRDYRATPALDLEGEPLPGAALREDRVWRAGVAWVVPVFPHRTGQLAVDLDLGYAFTDHRSTDAFYDYVSHAFGLTFSVVY